MISRATKSLVLLLLLSLTTVRAFASSSSSTFSTLGRRHASISRRQDSLHLGHAVLTGAKRPSAFERASSLALFPRGGEVTATGMAKVFSTKTPAALFNTVLIGLGLCTVAAKMLQRSSSSSTDSENAAAAAAKPASVKSLQRKFLSVFWLLRCADWLQGPYFVEVYSSKIFNGATASLSLVSRLFLAGFASTALFGPAVGRAADTYGRKRGTLAFTLLYAAGALSTKSLVLQVLFLGRILSGIGTSLLFSAPESWLVGEAQGSGDDPDGKYLGETFGLAYAGDSIVAICAGQMAAAAAASRGPTGPFELSTLFLMAGGLLAAATWAENKAGSTKSTSSNDEDEDETAQTNSKPSIAEAMKVVLDDPKIMLVGGVQSLFEAAMYIFVLQWPPAMTAGIAKAFGAGSTTPYGTIFSCFMASCLLGSTLFGQLAKMNVPTEDFTVGMLSVATLAMTGATVTVGTTQALWAAMTAFFAFEACVGMYFPSIGTLRSKYVPDSHRSVIMNLFGIPLNVLVVSVFLSIKQLGVQGALGVSSSALGLATICMFQLNRMTKKRTAAIAA